MQASIPLLMGMVVLVLLISLPCGYVRQNYKKYSFMWFLMIHLPIPLIVVLRVSSRMDWHFIPLTLSGAVAGQLLGGYLGRTRNRDEKTT